MKPDDVSIQSDIDGADVGVHASIPRCRRLYKRTSICYRNNCCIGLSINARFIAKTTLSDKSFTAYTVRH